MVSSTAKSLSITKLVTVAPVAISGPTSACGYYANGITANYSISAVANATSYLWTIPSYATIVTGQNTTSITVRFDSGYVTSNIKVKAVNACSVSAEKLLSVAATPYAKPGAISGSVNACSLINTGISSTYTIRKVENAPAYLWVMPIGITLVDHPGGRGVNDTIINVIFHNQFVLGSTIQVSTSGCTNSLPSTLAISGSISATPGAISGSVNVCEAMRSSSNPAGTSLNYSIRKVTGATSYVWTAPTNATIISHPAGSGVNDTIVTVVYASNFISGNLTVKSANYCGNSVVSSLAIARSAAATPGKISTVVLGTCPNRVYKYSIASMPANATGLVWSIPSIGTIVTGQGTLTITVSYPSTAITGTVSVQSINNCSSSSLSSLTVSLAACSAIAPAPAVLIAKSTVSEVVGKTKMTFDIYPNPSTSYFNIKVSSADSKSSTVRVLDMMGRLIKLYSVNEKDKFTFGDDLRPGSYIVEVISGTSKTSKCMIKL